MGNINLFLRNIKEALFGYEVRDSIHDAIKQCYNDAIANGHTDMEVAIARGLYDTLGDRLDKYSSAEASISLEFFKTIDNTYDDAFRLCLEYAKANNVKIVIPSGTYILTQPIVIDFNANIEGCGYSTILRFEGLEKGSYCITFHNNEQQLNYINFGNLRIDGTRETDLEVHGIHLNQNTSASMSTPIVNSNFHDLYIYNCDIGLEASYIWCDVFTNVRVQNCYRPLRLHNQVNNILFNRCSFVTYDAYCDFINCEGLQFNSCEFANTSGSVITLYQSNITMVNPYLENLESGLIRIGNDSETIYSQLYIYGGIVAGRFVPMTHRAHLRIEDSRFTTDKITVESPNAFGDKCFEPSHYSIRGFGLGSKTYIKKYNYDEGDEFSYYAYAWGGGTYSSSDEGHSYKVTSDSGINLRTSLEVGKQYTIEMEVAFETGITGLGIYNNTSLPLSIDRHDGEFRTYYIPFIAQHAETRLLFNGSVNIKKLNVYEGLLFQE